MEKFTLVVDGFARAVVVMGRHLRQAEAPHTPLTGPKAIPSASFHTAASTITAEAWSGSRTGGARFTSTQTVCWMSSRGMKLQCARQQAPRGPEYPE
jgi:hypothetical protein